MAVGASAGRVEKTVAVCQSNYVPWKGYFDLIGLADEFILYDDVQYTRRDWRNRNKIKTPQGVQWLTIPVNVKGRFFQPIDETEISDPGWAQRHLASIRHSYRHTPYFRTYEPLFADLYEQCASLARLSEINYRFLAAICNVLGIRTRLHWSRAFPKVGDKTERLIGLCRQVGATRYLSGPAARAYIDETLFVQAGMDLAWMDYSGYPEYPQLFPPFDHAVSVLDLLFNTGPSARNHMQIGMRGK
jgi:hypothetical protein